MNLELRHKNALVCGSTAGIGKATALMLAQEGANVTLLARNEDKLKAVLQELATTGGQQHGYVVADFNHPEQVKEAVEKRLGTIGAIHILVNNTGGPAAGPVYEASLDAFAKAFTQHLQCNQILAQTVIPGMKKAGYGRIINVISTSVKQPLDGLGVSNTIRGAVANWSKTLANEMGPFGITVNNVLPGATATGRLAEIIENKAKKSGGNEEEVSAKMKSSVPAQRFAEPEELASAISFLASARAAYINGINLPVDGGRTKCL
ncbi:SDR family oxidoreductase [Croceiramulus getboli]|nr:SDR family oxidoreductase [Flavobacteriaceae bacterium YJPT1-3]